MVEGARGADRILEGLNAPQAAAVTHETGPLLIIAGAGTGKTTVITRRIAYLIATRAARPSEILALTFTDKAAAEMKSASTPSCLGYAVRSHFPRLRRPLIRRTLELGLTDFRVLTGPSRSSSCATTSSVPLEAYVPSAIPGTSTRSPS